MRVKWKQYVIKYKISKKYKHFITDNLVLSVSSFPFRAREDLTNESLVYAEKFEFTILAIILYKRCDS